MLGLPERQVRVIAPFIGGGFGPKIMMFYPEEVLIPWAAMRLGRPVKWIEDRREHFFATTQERGQIHDAEIALDARRPHPRRARTPSCTTPAPTIPTGSPSRSTASARCSVPTSSPNYDSEFTAVFTNKPIVTPYRGAGRQHGVFVIERLLDIAARELGIDRAEIRRRNFIPPDAFPYDNEIIYQDFAPLDYDSGNYAPMLDKALEMIGYERFLREEQPRLRAQGPACVGIGVVVLRRRHRHRPLRGRQGAGADQRQGERGHRRRHAGPGALHQSFAQIVADQLGVDVSRRRGGHRRHRPVLLGRRHLREPRRGRRRQRRPRGGARRARRRSCALAAEHFECAEEDLVIADGEVCGRRRAAASAITLGELAREGQSAARRGAARAPSRASRRRSYFGPPRGATASGVHAMIVEVDPEDDGARRSQSYVVVHDCGTVINPLIVEGQMHGGVAQGIGNAFYEQLVFDDEGQLLNASLTDYPAADRARRAAHGARPHRDAVAAQSARHQGRGRGRRDSGRRRCSRRRSRMPCNCRNAGWSCWKFR